MSGIGLPKGMSRDDAYVQGMADAEYRAALTRRTLARHEGMCPGSWMELENLGLPRTGLKPCAECGLQVTLNFDQNNSAFYPVHTINLRCRFCHSRDVEATGKASILCLRCDGVGKGLPS